MAAPAGSTTKRVMSVFHVPLGVANAMYVWGWVASIAGAFVTLVGVLSLFIAALARDKDADQRISQANAVAGQAADRVAQAQRDAAVANREAARANEAAERLRLENAQLQDRLRPRTLSSDQAAKLEREMKRLSDGRPAIVVWSGGAEAENYAREIGHALTRAGFHTTVGTNITIMSAHGVVVAYQTGTTDTYAKRAVVAFSRAGVPAEIGELDHLGTEPRLYVVVGYKPGEPSP
jgi:hypothetical protein